MASKRCEAMGLEAYSSRVSMLWASRLQISYSPDYSIRYSPVEDNGIVRHLDHGLKQETPLHIGRESTCFGITS